MAGTSAPAINRLWSIRAYRPSRTDYSIMLTCLLMIHSRYANVSSFIFLFFMLQKYVF